MTGDFSNMLGIDAERGVLTGTVTGPRAARILDADGKRRTLEILCHQAGARSNRPSPQATAPTISR